ncbi:MAG: hypothetical protein WKF71_16355 [Pyrinomonadaceae bacterium]
MNRLIFSIICSSFLTAFVFRQTPLPIQAGITVEREYGGFIGSAFIRKGNGAARQAVVHYLLPDDRTVI